MTKQKGASKQEAVSLKRSYKIPKNNLRGGVGMTDRESWETMQEPHSADSHIMPRPKPVLIYLPGSQGRVSIHAAKLLDSLSDTYDVHPLQPEPGSGLWAVSCVSSPRNIDAAKALIERKTGGSGRDWFLVASSFGCRVAAELLNPFLGHLAPEQLPAALVCLGIPLYADSKSRDINERVNHFRSAFPQHLRILLCSGASDVCIHAKAPKSGPQGEALLRAQADSWRCAKDVQVHLVPGGSHSVLDCKATEAQGVERVIRRFLSLFSNVTC